MLPHAAAGEAPLQLGLIDTGPSALVRASREISSNRNLTLLSQAAGNPERAVGFAQEQQPVSEGQELP